MNRKDVLVSALRKAGAVILKYDPATVTTALKTNAGDLVTAADIASEKNIINTIKATFPNELVIAEETQAGQEKLSSDNLSRLTGWVVDPIDGTNNFRRGMAYSGISIGYIEHGEIVLGGILDPYRNQLYLAEIGGGATCNDLPIHVSSKTIFDPGTRVCV